MGKGSAPTPPDPKETAAAQTSTNLSTAQANAALGNVNQVTPYGNLTYSQTGQQFINDPNGASYWMGPNGQYQTSAPAMVQGASTSKQEPIYSQMHNGGDRLVGYKDVETPGSSSIPEGWSQVNGYYVPTYTATQTLSPSQQAIFDQTQGASQNLAKLANQQSGFLTDYLGKPLDLSSLPAGGNASNLTMPQYQQIGSGPQLQTQIGNAGSIATGYSNGGAIQRQIGDAGQITRDYGPADGYAGNVQAVQDAMFSRLNPQIDQQRSALETSLANQGIRLGSDAYENAMRQFQNGVNDQRTSILLSAGQEQSRLADLDAQRAGFQNAAQQQAYSQALASGQFANAAQAQQNSQNAALAGFQNAAQQQQFGQNTTQAQFGNDAQQQMYQNRSSATAQNNALQDQYLNSQLAQFNAQNQQRTQALNESYAARSQPINEIAALMGGAQVQQPNFVNANMPNIPTVDYAGLVNENYNQRLGAWQQQQAQSNSILGGLFGLGSSFIMASDRRVKEDVHRIGKTKDGQNLYAFRYKGDPSHKPQIGLMAQEVEKKRPDAVIEIGGVKHVDYGKALGGLFGLGQKEAA